MKQLFYFLENYIHLTELERNFILSIGKSKHLNRNDFFLIQGKKNTTLTFLINGSFRFFRLNKNGEEVNTDFILDNGFVTDLIELTGNAENQFSIQALEESDIIILDWQKIKLEKQLYKKLKILGNTYLNKVCFPALLNYQLFMSETPSRRYELLSRKYPHYIQRIAQKHIASYLRLRPETLSRIRKKFIDLNQPFD